ncbi:Outer membrane receptor proteins, mostly Fe transport [Chitinophaga ginsengisegetis]|uniref:Outer membrane receptor proteins, mostly Fe transport n=1 Tax=Chitinophaga ginsengisegetis TaxID=393003 RepID=A0A1T5NL73_9BACT|nr:TonB-dependent receptor [Chitinophaga ginsengisegetis]SKD01380.1 Outer membrane receptor proteins, mostly Fe transport [Chitinophaga ginsengisegetis]
MKQCCLLLIACMAVGNSYAQQIHGRVADAQTKEALPGVNVRLLHAANGCNTNAQGKYELTAAAADSIEISYVGYVPMQLPAETAANMPVIYLRQSTTSLNEIIVSSSRDKQQRSEAPVAISTISAQTLSETKATTLDKVLNKVSGVYMVDLGNEQHTMAIRQPIGYKSLFLYLEDGIPIRTIGDFNHNALIEINMAALKTVEVIRGPASSLYGSEAVGGAVNFITASPTLVPTARIQLEGSNRGYKRTDFSVSNTVKKMGFAVNGYYANQTNGYMDHSDFHKLALTAKVDYQINEKNKWTNAATLINYKTDQTGGLDSIHFFAKDYRSFQTFTYREVKALRVHSTLEHEWDNSNHTTFTAFFRNNTIGQNPFYAIKDIRGTLKANGQINSDGFNSYGIIAQHKKQFSWKQAALIAGVSADYSPATYVANYIDITKDAAGYYTSYRNTDSLLTDYRVGLLNSAVYTQFEFSPLPEMRVVAALRYDRMDYNFENHLAPSAYTGAPSERNNFNALTPKLGFTYNLGKNRGLYANYSVGFAPPNISELYTGVKVPVLKSATYQNYEAGGWFAFAQQKGYADLSIYRMNGSNEIISVRNADGVYENRNTGATTHSGVEWNVKYTPLRSLLIRTSGTYAEHIFKAYADGSKVYNNNQMSGAPKWITNTEVTWKPALLNGFRLGAEWQHISKYYMDPANTSLYNGYNLFNARAGYAYKGFECWLNCMNIGDQLYATTAEKSAYGKTYRVGPRQTFNLGVAYTFTGKK